MGLQPIKPFLLGMCTEIAADWFLVDLTSGLAVSRTPWTWGGEEVRSAQVRPGCLSLFVVSCGVAQLGVGQENPPTTTGNVCFPFPTGWSWGSPAWNGGRGHACPLEGEKEVGSMAMQRCVDAVQRLVLVSHEAYQHECITRRTWHILVFDVISCFLKFGFNCASHISLTTLPMGSYFDF